MFLNVNTCMLFRDIFSKGTIAMIVTMTMSVAYNSWQEKTHTNCELKDFEFVDFISRNQVEFNILDDRKLVKRPIKVTIPKAYFPLNKTGVGCEAIAFETMKHKLRNAINTSNPTLFLKSCMSRDEETTGEIYINDKKFFLDLITSKKIPKPRKWYHIFRKKIDWCDYIS
ncbi:hypothetical protein [Candidatus Deianiraea vastatrix]|uniref:Uncharacterized protein n=1 Tax=Candidatus Deianiraea vastatrix TaxID=2163644 RepID=A0A5B8XIS3_9RICK|nr:hypothetical protein [Candidatus Deianiraea vastatrix]QED23537.1 hypothetical protein Deia_00747 [Candidatus Deianiraea vastatrix]